MAKKTIHEPIMNRESLLIFDLDDTIFETRSIGAKHFEGIFGHFRRLASREYSKESLDVIEEDLWKLPFDQVASRYQFSNELSKQWSRLINETQFCFTIHPFPDFEYIKATAFHKVLVTTGFKHLQEAKIAALGIASEFDDIHIDEIDSEDRIFKSGIFEKVVSESSFDRKDHIVIGDNPESELKAGSALGLITVQMAKFGQPASPYANHYITDFAQLLALLNDEGRKSF